MAFSHKSVLLDECIEGLNIRPEGIYLDGTLGGAGHSLEIVRRLTTGRLIGVDRDTMALEAAKERLAPYLDRVTLVHSNFTGFSRNWGFQRWMECSLIWGSPLPSWTRQSAAFPTWPRHRWTCA